MSGNMGTVNIGTWGTGGAATADVELLMSTRMLVQANSGGGKSWLLRRLAEQLFGRVQVIIIDPDGDFATLREKFGYVLAGTGGETPTAVRSAGLLATKLLELHASAVCDLYELQPRDRHAWVRGFIEGLMNSEKRLWHPVVVIVDEAHLWCPEKGESEAASAMIDLATRGRRRGFCAIWATQRLAKLRKDAAAELTNVLIGKTFIDVDRERAADCLGVSRADRAAFDAEVRALKPGQFYCLGRALTMTRTLMTVGPVSTSHPEAGSGAGAEAKPTPAPAAIAALLPKLADLPAEAEKRAKTEAELRAEIRSLQGRLAQTARPAADPGQLAEAKRALAESERSRQDFARAVDSRLAVIATAIGQLKDYKCAPAPTAAHSQPATVRQQPPPRRIQAPSLDSSLPKGELASLRAIAMYADGADRDQLAVLTGYKRSSRDAYIQRLREKGYVETRGTGIVATDAGIAALGTDFEPLPTGDALREYWMSRLPEGERAVLRVLIAAGGAQVRREAIDDATGYKRSSRDAYLQRLGSRRLVERDGAGVRAAGVLFE